jgi:hypothetical protein
MDTDELRFEILGRRSIGPKNTNSLFPENILFAVELREVSSRDNRRLVLRNPIRKDIRGVNNGNGTLRIRRVIFARLSFISE